MAFRQVYLSPDRRGDAAERDAQRLLSRLKAGGSAIPGGVGDPSMLPQDVERTTRSGIAAQFGDDFANAVVEIEPGAWAGPVRSAYGLHLVWVYTRDEGRLPALEAVRPVVERELLSARRQERVEAMYAELLSRYTVVVERRR